jgi:hypothetical protein
MTVVPGAVNGAPYVDQTDFHSVRKALGRTATNLGAAVPFYNPTADLDADGRVNFTDLAHVRKRLYTSAPTTVPAASTPADFDARVRARPLTRGLFSAAPILA